MRFTNSGFNVLRRTVSIAAGLALIGGFVLAAPIAANARPTVTRAAPIVTGDCTVGGTITADFGLPPEDNPPIEWAVIRAQYGRGVEPSSLGVTTPSLVIPPEAGPWGGYSYRVFPFYTVTYYEEDGSSYKETVRGEGCVVSPAPGPVNTSPPTATGDVRVGSTLTAGPGQWSMSDGWEYFYTWSGAPSGEKKGETLYLDAGLLGRQVTLTVTARKRGWVTMQASITLQPVAPGAAPVSVSGPRIEGTAQVGSALSVDPGTWSLSGLSYACSWFRGTTKLASTCSYTPGPGSLEKDLFVKVIGSRQGYSTGPAVATPSVRITAGAAATVSRAPVISGTATVGEILTLDRGDWTSVPPGSSYTYQWYRSGLAVSGRTSAAYALGAADAGKTITAVVKVAAPGYATASLTATAPNPVAKGAKPSVTAAPKITGTTQVGSTLIATSGTWSKTGLSYSYAWYRSGTAIPGATSSKYTLKAADQGRTITVRVTATSTAWNTNTAISAGTTRIALGPAPKATNLPAIFGTPKAGQTLKVSSGSWTPAAGRYTYQWYANGVAIPGATSPSYFIKIAQRGKTLTVKVTAYRSGHVNGMATSKTTTTIK